MNLNEKIQVERNKVANEIEQFQNQNAIDMESLEVLKEDYNKALFSSKENELDAVNAQIKEVTGRINRRKEKMAALQNENNPFIQSLISEEMGKWLEEVSTLKSKAEATAKKLEPKRKELVNGLAELVQMKYKMDGLNSVIKSYGQQLNETNRKQLGLNNVGLDNKVLNNILPLLVEHKEVFKVR